MTFHEKASAILESLRRHSHFYVDEDCWYSCPAHPDYCGKGSECNCGLDEHNKKIDALIELFSAAHAQGRAEGAAGTWRLLDVGEVTQEGDEVWNGGSATWGVTSVGDTHGRWPVRRRIVAGRAEGAAVSGWRLLEEGETIRAGDEFLNWHDQEWQDVGRQSGTTVSKWIVRRRFALAAVDAAKERGE